MYEYPICLFQKSSLNNNVHLCSAFMNKMHKNITNNLIIG